MPPISPSKTDTSLQRGTPSSTSKPLGWLGPGRSLPGAALIGLALLLGEYVTGPFIQFPILLVVPVTIAAWFHNRRWGLVFAVALPITHTIVRLAHQLPWTPVITALNGLILTIVLVLFAYLIDQAAQRRRLAEEVRMLRGLLPICSFCKRIEKADGTWEVIEKYIADRTEAEFTHSICPSCARQHYHIDLERIDSRRPSGMPY